ncbi:hypothetical protein Leryth_017686 [Lithospermum erythrorhizon]|nr:hypothetical protein Leryth_017686 [Lithospermum erythrorhizon]
MQRYLIAIEYIGSRFSGAQIQAPIFRTVVGVLQKAFHKFIGQPVSVVCSSRTDAGVHALSNVFHVDVQRISKRKPNQLLPPHDPAVVKRAVNHFLQVRFPPFKSIGFLYLDQIFSSLFWQKNEGDISVIDVRSVPPNFHSRYQAIERTYFYRLLSGPEALSTFEKDRAWHVPEEIDILAMQEACKVLVGQHDFSSFRAAGCEAKSPIRTLEELSVIEVTSTPYFPSIFERKQLGINFAGDLANEEFGMRRRNQCLVVTARSRSFLYHQVRLLVGVLKSVGTGDLTVLDVERILKAKTVTAASPMAPAGGLYLGQLAKYTMIAQVERKSSINFNHSFLDHGDDNCAMFVNPPYVDTKKFKK